MQDPTASTPASGPAADTSADGAGSGEITDKAPFPFTSLPLEIRCQIYRELFPVSYWFREPEQPRDAFNLALVSHNIALEARDTFYRYVTLDFWHPSDFTFFWRKHRSMLGGQRLRLRIIFRFEEVPLLPNPPFPHVELGCDAWLVFRSIELSHLHIVVRAATDYKKGWNPRYEMGLLRSWAGSEYDYLGIPCVDRNVRVTLRPERFYSRSNPLAEVETTVARLKQEYADEGRPASEANV